MSSPQVGSAEVVSTKVGSSALDFTKGSVAEVSSTQKGQVMCGKSFGRDTDVVKLRPVATIHTSIGYKRC